MADATTPHLDDTLALLRDARRVAITTHVSPDGDAIGSVLALGRMLEKLGKEDVFLVTSDQPPVNTLWMPGVEKVTQFDGSVEQRERLAQADLLVIADVNGLDRLGEVSGSVKASGAKKLLIDHHTHPEGWFDVVYRREAASSTGELVYEIMRAFEAERDELLLDGDLATALYVAVMTDTGSFRFSNVTGDVHRMVADLLDRGPVEPAPIHSSMFDNRSRASLDVLGMVLRSLSIEYGGRVAYVVVTHQMLQDASANPEDTEGLVNYALSLAGVEAALIFKEVRRKGTKVSFRSLGETAVNGWAREFGGGGHRNAAGAFVKKSLGDTINAVIQAAPKHLEGLGDFTAADDRISDTDAQDLAAMMMDRRR